MSACNSVAMWRAVNVVLRKHSVCPACGVVLHVPLTTINMHSMTMLQYYIGRSIVLTVVLVLGSGLGFGIILYFVIGT